MSDQPVYVVSDIHLGGVPDSTEHTFRAFLAALRGRTSELVINGDLFDFWFEYRTVVQARHYRVLAALADLRDAGVTIRFLGGNHDAWGGDFLRDRVGIDLLPDRAELDLAGRKTLIVHGDGVGEGDLGYRALKTVLRHPLSARAFRLLHPDLGSRLAAFVSTTEGKHGTPGQANAERAAALQDWAAAEMKQRADLELILAGHTHTPTVLEVSPGRHYVNTGDWINHFTYAVIEPGAPPALRTWSGGTP